MVPAWVKVVAGVLALLIGASAPALIIEALRPDSLLAIRSRPLAPAVPGQSNTHIGDCHDCERDVDKGFWQRSLSDPVAIGTFILAAATVILALASLAEARGTRREIILNQRPKIRIRNVVIRPPNIPGHYPSIFVHNHLVSGQLYAVNVGGTRATITEAHGEVYWTNAGVSALPMERPYEGKNPNLPDLRIALAPGQSVPLTFQSDTILGVQGSAEILSGMRFVYVLGFVAYEDDLGIARRTAFCRRFDNSRRRFFALENDPDYEHEE